MPVHQLGKLFTVVINDNNNPLLLSHILSERNTTNRHLEPHRKEGHVNGVVLLRLV